MPITTTNAKKAAMLVHRFDWSEVDAFTDSALAKQIQTNPDAAPDITAALKSGAMQRPVSSAQIKAVRHKTGLSQPRFAARLNLHVATLRNWEQGRTLPDGAAITLLHLINRAPKTVMRMLEEQAR